MHERVFSPLQVGGTKIPNRIVRTAHATLIATNQSVNDDLLRYHLERAEGGVGLSILEAASVHPSSALGLLNWDDSVIPQYEKLVHAVAPTGMKLFQQLWHGGHIYPAADGGPPWAPTAVTARYAIVPPVEMTTDQVEELVAAFAAAAARVEAGGLDGVELHAGHGYLVSQFLSPVLNRREDQYGGAAENRMRFLIETLRAIRGSTSSGFAVGMRISDSADPRMFSAEDANTICRHIESEGLIDYVNLSHSDYYDNVEVVAGMDRPAGYQLPISRRIGAGLSIPRLIAGRFGTLDDAEQALRAGDADLVSMVRATIADPMLVRKVREGRAAEVRPCIACNQGCIGGAVMQGRMGCVVNPAAGQEHSLSETLIGRGSQPRRVLIIGGGPAGMEAARIAALRGHSVTLMEAGPRLGGMINHARRMPKLQAIGDIAHWLESEVYRLGVDVRLSTFADAVDIVEEAPDELIVATGTGFSEEPLRQVADPAGTVQVGPGARVLDSIALLDNPNLPGKAAIVLDDIGHYEAIGCCEELLGRGMDVTYVTRHSSFAPQIEVTMRTTSALKRLHALGRFRIVTHALLVSVDHGIAAVRPIQGMTVERLPADVVVRVDYRAPASSLWLQLRKRIENIHLVGDAKAPRNLQTAIREGNIAARSVA